jgi:hypothetical protein
VLSIADMLELEKELETLWSNRTEVFSQAVSAILATQPIGLALKELYDRSALIDAQVANLYDRLKRGRLQPNQDLYRRLVSMFLGRSDGQNFMIFGDPAIRVRIPNEQVV